MEAGTLKRIGDFYLAPGYSTEFMAVFLATDLKHNPLEADDDEILQVEKISIKKAIEMAQNGETPDAKSLAALFLVRQHLNSLSSPDS
jgi:ADP-ribose pyrophosphatase